MAKRFRSILILPNTLEDERANPMLFKYSIITKYDMGSIQHHEISAKEVWLSWRMILWSLCLPTMLTTMFGACMSTQMSNDAEGIAFLGVLAIFWVFFLPPSILFNYWFVQESIMRSIALRSRGLAKDTPMLVVFEKHWEDFRKKLV